MKNILKILMPAALMIVVNSCNTQSGIPSDKAALLVKSGEFAFMAERANPTGNDVVNILNALPNSSSSNVLNLDYGYTLVIKKDEIKAELPYFGRMYTPNFDTDKNSYRFTSKDFTLKETSGKKGSAVYTIQPKDLQNIRKIVLETFKNGKAYLSIEANDRQSISYDGYITENAAVKK